MRQAEYWNDYAGESWAAQADRVERVSGGIGNAALAVAAAEAGERVLDVGCGTGATTLALARAVGPSGTAVGLDVSAPMIAVARKHLAAAGLPWAEFREQDIEKADLEPSGYDLAYSRMCLMLLDDPVAGCAAIRRALRPGGRLVAVVFRTMAENPWLPAVVLGAAAHVEGLPPLPMPGEPGPFAFADPALAGSVLAEAGFTDVAIRPLDDVARPEGTPAEVADLLIQLGPAGGAYRRQRPEIQAAARESVSGLLTPLAEPDGRLALPTAAWLITARRPSD